MTSARLVLATGAVALAACGTAVPAFTDTTGAAAVPEAAYPPPPYGVGIGSVLANDTFEGFRDPTVAAPALAPIRLSDFYNPHGRDATWQPAAGEPDDRLFPADSGYASAGKPKPLALLLEVGAVWCAPCNLEAKTVLPDEHALYQPCGGEFLLQLAESDTPGVTASAADLASWTSAYAVDYPGTLDPSHKLQPLFGVYAYPQNVIVDTTTMKIVATLTGIASAGLCDGVGAGCAADADCRVCSFESCGDGSACTKNADCAKAVCVPDPFWTQYEALLDKTRPGCSL